MPFLHGRSCPGSAPFALHAETNSKMYNLGFVYQKTPRNSYRSQVRTIQAEQPHITTQQMVTTLLLADKSKVQILSLYACSLQHQEGCNRAAV